MINPAPMRSGDLILVISPSYSPEVSDLEAGIQTLIRQGYQVERGPNLEKTWGRFAGTDQERLEDLQWAMNHSNARMILCSRGGYGLSRISEQLSFAKFAQNPKWVVGFSDVTFLHCMLQARGFATIHGPMAIHYGQLAQIPACLAQNGFLAGRLPIRYELQAEFPFDLTINGQISGGNLSLLAHYDCRLPEGFFKDKLVFIEETGEAYHKIDRMLSQLFKSGVFSGVNAFLLGQFTDCLDYGFPISLAEMIREKAGDSIPIFSGIPAGHGKPSFPLVLGMATEIKREGKQWWLKQEELKVPIF